MAAVAAGIRHVQATINGYGERCGNANMVSILANLALKTPHELVPAGGGSIENLTDLARSVAEIANQKPDDYQPYVGRSAFAHKGGVHGAAVAKVERSYQHVDPTTVGNVGRLVVVGARRQGEHPDPGRAARPPARRGDRPEGPLEPHQAARVRGPGVRGRRGELRAPHPPPPGGLRPAVPDRRLHVPRRAALRPGAPRRGDRQGRGRRRDPPHGRRRQRPGERPRRRAPQGAPGVLPPHRRRSTSSTTRSGSSTATRRRPPGRG